MAGVGLSEMTEKKLVINTNFYRNPWLRHRNHVAYSLKRRLEVYDFEFVATTIRDRTATPSDGRFERALSVLPESNKRVFGVASEESFIDGEWDRPGEISRLVGHFMSPEFFLKSTTMHRFQQFVNPTHSWVNQMSEIISDEKSVGIHLRLGDYLLQDEIVVPKEIYFLNAIEHLKYVLGTKLKAFLFTDEPKLLARKFPTLATQVELVVPPPEVSSAENLKLLSKCSAFVCSNSTFSWWGAHLSNVSSSLIIHPSTFYSSDPTRHSNLSLWEPNSISINPVSGEIVK
jgi:hypothetical protein